MPDKKVPAVMQDPDPENIIEVPILARAITDISRSVKSLLSSGLTRDAVITLVHRACGSRASRNEVTLVIQEIQRLENWAIQRKA